MSLNEFNLNLRKYLVHFLWRQWAQLGVASASVEKEDGWIIDPEALWLFSATFARYDARLFDEILDWILKNAAFINIPRLKSLTRRFGFDEMNVVAAMAAVVRQKNSRLNWRFSIAEKTGDATPLFLDVSEEPLPDFGTYDDTFLRFGFKRGKVVFRGLSRQFNADMSACALLRLRAFFGINARAETVLYLLTHDMAHPSHIARETGFSQKNVQDTLVDMSGSGLVHPAKLEGRMKMYFMKKDHKTPFLYRPETPASMDNMVACFLWAANTVERRVEDLLSADERTAEDGGIAPTIWGSPIKVRAGRPSRAPDSEPRFV